MKRETETSLIKAKDYFALALRPIAVIGLAYLARAFVRNPPPPNLALISRLVSILIAAYFLRGASLLVKLCGASDSAVGAESD